MRTPKDAADLFDNLVPEILAKNPTNARNIGAVFGFKILGDGGGEWTVDAKSATPTCKRGVSDDAETTFEIHNPDFMQILNNPAAAMQLYFQGKLRVTGDPMKATRFQKLFALE